MTNPDLSKLRKGDRVLVEMTVGEMPYKNPGRLVCRHSNSGYDVIDQDDIREVLPREIKVEDIVNIQGSGSTIYFVAAIYGGKAWCWPTAPHDAPCGDLLSPELDQLTLAE